MSNGDLFEGDGEVTRGSFEKDHRIVPGDEHADIVRVATATGPIAIAPLRVALFEKAVALGGGQLEDLAPTTRGLIWLSNTRVSDLEEVLEANPQLCWVQLPWAGVDAFADLLRRRARSDLIVTSAKGCYAQPVAEHALVLAQALLRYLPRRARAVSWDTTSLGISLHRKHVVIVGAGGIARQLIRLCEPYQVRVTIVRRHDRPVADAHSTVTADQLHSVLPEADVVILAAAATPDTHHLIGATELAMMKTNAALVNVARGSLVDDVALVAALESGHLVGAATDVTHPEPLPDGHPLWTAPNMLITPHMADTSEMTGPLLAERVRRNVVAFVREKPLEGVVNPSLGY